MNTSSRPPTDWTRVAALPTGRKWLLLRTFAVLVGYKAALRVLPFRRIAQPLAQAPNPPGSLPDVEAVAWAIGVLSRRVPFGFTCLVQAFAARHLLRRHPGVRVRIGVRKTPGEGFSAHAWVICRDRTLSSDATGRTYEPIAEWN